MLVSVLVFYLWSICHRRSSDSNDFIIARKQMSNWDVHSSKLAAALGYGGSRSLEVKPAEIVSVKGERCCYEYNGERSRSPKIEIHVPGINTEVVSVKQEPHWSADDDEASSSQKIEIHVPGIKTEVADGVTEVKLESHASSGEDTTRNARNELIIEYNGAGVKAEVTDPLDGTNVRYRRPDYDMNIYTPDVKDDCVKRSKSVLICSTACAITAGLDQYKGIAKIAKTAAQRNREYRARKKAARPPKKPPMSTTERVKKYRERRKGKYTL